MISILEVLRFHRNLILVINFSRQGHRNLLVSSKSLSFIVISQFHRNLSDESKSQMNLLVKFSSYKSDDASLQVSSSNLSFILSFFLSFI